MKLKLGTLRFILDGLEEIMRKELHFKLSYRVMKLQRSLLSELELFEKVRIKLVEKYAEKDENGKYKIDDKRQYVMEDLDGFKAEYEKLAEEETDVAIIPIPVSLLINLNVSPAALSKMFDILEDDLEGEKDGVCEQGTEEKILPIKKGGEDIPKGD